MFGRKKQVNLTLKMDSGYHQLIVDYFDAKDKATVRSSVYECLGALYDSHLLQADSNFVNKAMEGKEGEWMEALAQWGQDSGLPVDSFRYKREISAGFLGSLMGNKVTKPGYRIGVLLDSKNIPETVAMHQAIGLGVHLGSGVLGDARETLLKDYCGGRIDEFNFERYYTIDFYDYDLISRCVMKCLTVEPLEAIRSILSQRLPE